MPKILFRQYPPTIQLLIFMVIWLVCQLLAAGTVFPLLLKLFSESSVNMSDFQQQPAAFPAITMWVNFLGSILLYLIPAALFSIIISSNPTDYLGFKKITTLKMLPWIILLGTAMVFILPGISEWLQKTGFGNLADELQKQRLEMEAIYFSERSGPSLLRNAILMALVPAFCEEIFFRGTLQRLLYAISKHKWIAIIATSVLFSLVHNSIYNFLPIFIASLILGYTYFETGSLWISILLHFIYNLVQVIIVHISAPEKETITDSLLTRLIIEIAAVGAILLSLRMIYKYKNPDLLRHIKGDTIKSN